MGIYDSCTLPRMVTNRMLESHKACITAFMSLSGFDEFCCSLFLANLSTFVVAAQSILKQMWLGFESSSEWDTVWLTLQSTQAFFTATNYATINLTGVSWLHWSQRRDSGFQLVWDMKGGGGDECPWASAWWIGQRGWRGVRDGQALCAQTPGPSLQKRMKGGFVSAKGWKERD